MTFQEFAYKTGNVLKGNNSQGAYTKSLFEEMLTDEDLELIDDLSPSTWKGYYGGNPITEISKIIRLHIKPRKFESYINGQAKRVKELLCNEFLDDLPGATVQSIAKLLSETFESIILNAAKGNTEKTDKNRSGEFEQLVISRTILNQNDTSPDISLYDLESEDDNGLFVIQEIEEKRVSPFRVYLEKASRHYSEKRTLLNLEQPQPFQSIYVCSDLVRSYTHATFRSYESESSDEILNRDRIKDASIDDLEKRSKCIVIEGTGGIGKSMFLTNLFLKASQQYLDGYGRIPILVSLKDYNENTTGFLELARTTLHKFDPFISMQAITDAFANNEIALLLDGLDEIPSSYRDNFDKDLDAFIKCYQDNLIVVTSRPIRAFLTHTRFSMFQLWPLSLSQANSLINKITLWNNDAKQNFLQLLNTGLYYTHYPLASNPLLLTIMLMTYAYFGATYGKSYEDMHVFYGKAYETMSRLHDQANKDSFERPLHTHLTPEKFSEYFAQFCGRTYTEEALEFSDIDFAYYINKVIKAMEIAEKELTPDNFALDLTENLCLMYHEGEKYYFIHRSFQEYFAALYFAFYFERDLKEIGDFFEDDPGRSFTDHTFDMLYGLSEKKVIRQIFLPYLRELFDACRNSDNEYHTFVKTLYPTLYIEKGHVGEGFINGSASFIYCKIREKRNIHTFMNFDILPWPQEIYKFNTSSWVSVFKNFESDEAFERFPNPDEIPEELLEYSELIPEDSVPYRYEDYFGKPSPQGETIELDTAELFDNPQRFPELSAFMEADGFPLLDEFKQMKEYYLKLQSEEIRQSRTKKIFND